MASGGGGSSGGGGGSSGGGGSMAGGSMAGPSLAGRSLSGGGATPLAAGGPLAGKKVGPALKAWYQKWLAYQKGQGPNPGKSPPVSMADKDLPPGAHRPPPQAQAQTTPGDKGRSVATGGKGTTGTKGGAASPGQTPPAGQGKAQPTGKDYESWGTPEWDKYWDDQGLTGWEKMRASMESNWQNKPVLGKKKKMKMTIRTGGAGAAADQGDTEWYIDDKGNWRVTQRGQGQGGKPYTYTLSPGGYSYQFKA